MTNRGATGAKRRSYHPVSLRSIVVQVMEGHKTAGRDEVIRRVKDAVHDHADRDTLLDSALEAAISNDYNALVKDEKRPAPPVRLVTPAAKAERRAAMDKLVTEAKQELNEIVEKRARVKLLELVMPNGKMLGECTFHEAGEAGGWLTNVAKLGSPDQIIGEVLSEAKLQGFYEAGK